MSPKSIADHVETTLRASLPGYGIARLRAQDHLLGYEAAAAAILIFEEYEDDNMVGFYVATKLLGSFDASRMLNGRVIEILAAEGIDMVEGDLSVQVVGLL